VSSAPERGSITAAAAAVADPDIATAQRDLALLGHAVSVTGALDAETRTALAWVAPKYGWTYSGRLTTDLAAGLHRLALRARTGPAACRALVPRLLCVDEKLLLLLVMERGKVVQRLDVRLSGVARQDRPGSFRVYRSVPAQKSVEFHAWMYDVLFFDGGRAIHYSPTFARVGYTGRSQGCVNIRDKAAMDELFASTRRGTPVEIVPPTAR
jgi:hypothetical protein